MPFTHRNLLVVMIVGCVVGVLGAGKTACAFDGVTFHFRENTNTPAVPAGYWDDMYFMIGGGGTYGPINSNGTALDQNTSYPCSTYPWVTIADPIFEGGLYICYDPNGTGISNPNNKPIQPGETDSPGYNKRWQYFEFSSGSLDVSVVDSYGLPLKVWTDETLRVSFASTDKEIRQALYSNAKTRDKARVVNPEGFFVRYLSPTNCFENSKNDVWPDFSEYFSSLVGIPQPCAQLAWTIQQYPPYPAASCSGGLASYPLPPDLQWNLNVTISQSNDIYTANLNGTVNNANLTAPIKFSGSATEWTSAIYQQKTVGLTVHTGSATMAHADVVFQDLTNGFIMGMYGSQQSWKLNPANHNCATNAPCCGAIDPLVPYSPYRPVFIADSNPDDSSKVVANLESAAWYWTAPDAVFTNPRCSKWDKVMQQNGNSSVFSWTLKNAWRGKGERAQLPVTNYCTVMVQSLTQGLVTCNGDLNSSFNTDIDDLLLMVEGWGTTDGDVTGDGFSDIEDLLVVLGDYGCDHR